MFKKPKRKETKNDHGSKHHIQQGFGRHKGELVQQNSLKIMGFDTCLLRISRDIVVVVQSNYQHFNQVIHFHSLRNVVPTLAIMLDK